MDTCNHAGELGNFCTHCGTMLREPFPLHVPSSLRDLCRDWHSGQTSGMYSVSSVGHIANRDILVCLLCELRYTIFDCGENEDLASEKSIAQGALTWLDAFHSRLPE